MRRPTTLLSLSLALSLPFFGSSIARADEPSAPTTVEGAPAAPAPAVNEGRVWYGWQPLLVDAGSVAVSFAAGASNQGRGSPVLGVLGAGGLLLGSPIIHLVHGHPGKAGGSLALRTVLPAAGFFSGLLVGAALAQPDARGNDFEGALAGSFLGFLSGAIAAIAIDDALIAQEKAPPPPPPEPDFRIEPRVSSVRGGATFGVGGTF